VIAPLSDEKLNVVDRDLGVFGRLKHGVTVEQARVEMNALAQRLEPLRPNRKGWGVTVVPLKEAMVEYIRPALLVLLGAVGFVLLIGCANVANLLLARATGRQKEMAIRAALGATRLRVVVQLLTESVLLALLGGAAGLLLAIWTLGLLTSVVPRSIPIPDAAVEVLVKQIEIDGRVLAFTLLVSLVTGVVFGLVPALQASRSELQETLKQTGRAATGDLTRHRLRNALVASEITLALILLIGAGLLLKSFEHLQHVNPGFRSGHVLTMQMELPTDSKYRTGHEQSAFFHQMLERVQALPGVQSAGLTEITPLSQEETSRGFEVENRPPLAPGHFTAAQYRRISPNYFATLNIPLVQGRAFTDRDDADAPGVAILSATMARRYWPNEDPLGKKVIIRDGGGNPREVVGVVGDVKQMSLALNESEAVYTTEAQWRLEDPVMSLVVRTPDGKDRIISKGAPEAIFPKCASFELAARIVFLAESGQVEQLPEDVGV
jgi:putative ABC transport system permease protein